MDVWNTLAALGSQVTQWLPANADQWLADVAHPNGWAWFFCAVVAAIWVCSRFIVRPLAAHNATQMENQVQTLKFLRIAVDELRSELKSGRATSTKRDGARITVSEQQSAVNSTKSLAPERANGLHPELKTGVASSATAREPLVATW